LDRQIGSYASSRFAITSALGRLLWQSRFNVGKPMAVAQSDQSLVTQSRRANAFAAEFLLPHSVILRHGVNTAQMVGRLSETYGISRSAVRWHAYNVWKALTHRDKG
jgi:Zn-dependent peptidase ImmA (M78 family)